MSRKILNVPYAVEHFIKASSVHVVDHLYNVHITPVEREEFMHGVMAFWWNRGRQAHESFGFRWGLIIGAATGGLLLSVVHAIASAL